MSYKIEAFKTDLNSYYWRLKSKNKRIIAESESYTRKEMCLKTAKKLANSLSCKYEFVDLTKDYEY